MSWEDYVAAWSAVHHGINPQSSVWVRGYLRVVYPVAKVANSLRITPNVVTASGVVVSAVMVWAAVAQNLWLLAALMFGGIATDALDGALAIGQNRISAFGSVFDSVVDRINEAALLIALTLLAGWDFVAIGIAGFVVVMIVEYMRVRARAAKSDISEKVTVWERPTRVIVSIATIVSALFFEGFTLISISTSTVAIAGLAAWLTLGIVAAVQLTRHLQSQL